MESDEASLLGTENHPPVMSAQGSGQLFIIEWPSAA